ncbi:hypothetical protein BDN72DRAFT_836133 [Pluteus cervinus]|uniref:Uncharacterized protein n=1 Tax=Pluteus cervinus TaxID=181527 RepID=A0ACD3B4G7_9AGAR|nr:hypothetical protein BDN72DRAFT_836133 [Pluteus cervinus]
MDNDRSVLSVGEHCSLSSCNVQDFLPILCYCQRYYCRDHITPDEHQCPTLQFTLAETPNEPTTTPSPRCSLENCHKKVLTTFFAAQGSNVIGSPILCTGCNTSFCVKHRHPKSHVCPGENPTKQQSEESKAFQAVLAKNSPSTKAPSRPRPKSKVPTDPIKLEQYKKIELIKMRHRALPGDPKQTSLSLDQRIHVKFGEDPTPKVFWFSKIIIVGRVLDLLSSTSEMVNRDVPFGLYSVDEGDESRRQLLKNSEPLSAQIGDGARLQIHPTT